MSLSEFPDEKGIETITPERMTKRTRFSRLSEFPDEKGIETNLDALHDARVGSRDDLSQFPDGKGN